jgi:hypothetical protein
VLAGAAPKPDAPAIKYAESKEPHHAFAISAKMHFLFLKKVIR